MFRPHGVADTSLNSRCAGSGETSLSISACDTVLCLIDQLSSQLYKIRRWTVRLGETKPLSTFRSDRYTFSDTDYREKPENSSREAPVGLRHLRPYRIKSSYIFDN